MFNSVQEFELYFLHRLLPKSTNEFELIEQNHINMKIWQIWLHNVCTQKDLDICQAKISGGGAGGGAGNKYASRKLISIY